jgi:hypothetical protein
MVLLEQQANVCQSARRCKPSGTLWCGNERPVYRLEVIDIDGCWLDWFGKQSDSIQARLACDISASILRTRDSVSTVDIDSVYSVAYDGLRGTRVHFHIAPSNRFQYRSRIVGRLIKRSIAVDSAHTEQFDARIVCAEKKGVCVLQWMISNRGRRRSDYERLTSCPVSL